MKSGKMVLALAGNIGTGKTTLTQMLSQRFGWQAHYEAVADNPYLADFYSDMKRWAFPLQVYFLNNRYKSHKTLIHQDVSAILDRSIYEDAHIFARNLYETNLMSERDYRCYVDLYESLSSQLVAPDLVVYLRKSIPKLQSHIQRRGRDYEKNIPDSYLSKLNDYYDEWIEDYKLGPKITLDTDHLDFVANPNEFETLAKQILGALDQKDLFLR